MSDESLNTNNEYKPAIIREGVHRFFVEFSYLGTNYHGWQIQPNAHTVQAELDRVLSIVFRQEIQTLGAGRTDAGVHAKQMFAHFDADIPKMGFRFAKRKGEIDVKSDTSIIGDWLLQTGQIIHSVNMMLPYDIAVKRILLVHQDAHARFNANHRSYEYHVTFEKNPFLKGFAYYLHPQPDIAAMNDAAKLLFEYIDFSCFMKSKAQTNTNNCVVTNAQWIEVPNGMVFHISANRFLRNMVRSIVGTLLEVGRGRLDKEGFRAVIEGMNRSDAGMSVPACGLYLTEVKYPYIPD